MASRSARDCAASVIEVAGMTRASPPTTTRTLSWCRASAIRERRAHWREHEVTYLPLITPKHHPEAGDAYPDTRPQKRHR